MCFKPAIVLVLSYGLIICLYELTYSIPSFGLLRSVIHVGSVGFAEKKVARFLVEVSW